MNNRLSRPGHSYKYYSYRFCPPKRDYNRQYAGLYWYRLEYFRDLLVQMATAKWPQSTLASEIVNIDRTSSSIFVVGTLYLDLPGKFNILTDSNDDDIAVSAQDLQNSILKPSLLENDESIIYLEDISSRIQLSGDLLNSVVLFSGSVVALQGYESENGKFHVLDICYPGIPPNPSLISSLSPTLPLFPIVEGRKFIAFASGLSISSDYDCRSLSLMTKFLCGALGCSFDDTKLASQVVRLVVAGNTFHPSTISTLKMDKRKKDNDFVDFTFLDNVDSCFSQIASFLPLDILSGFSDPTNYVLPQKPIHKGIFGKSSALPGFSTKSNPYAFSIDEKLHFLGTSGQNIDDLIRYSPTRSPLEVAKTSLYLRHICPTAPDTLPCFPYNNEDPFILDHLPHVYFVGNMNKFETCLVKDEGNLCRVLMIPSFCKTNSMVLLDLNSLEPFEISFSAY